MPCGGRKPHPRPNMTGATNRISYSFHSLNAIFTLLIPLVVVGISAQASFGQVEQSLHAGTSVRQQFTSSLASAQSNTQASLGGASVGNAAQEESQTSSPQSSPSSLKNRLQLHGTQASDPATASQQLQCKPPEEKKDAWRPETSSEVNRSLFAEDPPSTRRSFENATPRGSDQGTSTLALPPSPPIASSPQTVTYSDGKLAIKARDVTLSEILASIRAHTGAAIDCAPGLAEDRVFVDISPMPMQDALVALLDGSNFNYILKLGPNPQLVKQIILTPRVGELRSNVASASAASPPPAGPEVNGVEAYIADPADETVPIQSAPNTIPTIPASLGLSVTDEDLKKPTVQLLQELQRRQIQQLDAAEAARAAEAAASNPPQ
jgi:hypothetical protein